MSEVIIRNNISNTNFIIEYNLDMKLPKEADDSQKFLAELINSEYQSKNLKNLKENYNEKEYENNNNHIENLNNSKQDNNDVILSSDNINNKNEGIIIIYHL